MNRYGTKDVKKLRRDWIGRGQMTAHEERRLVSLGTKKEVARPSYKNSDKRLIAHDFVCAIHRSNGRGASRCR